MIFSSFHFLLIFLPLAVGGYAIATKLGPIYSATWLAICSFTFYAAWNVQFVLLLAGSIIFNFAIGTLILKNERKEKLQTLLLTVGIAGNLSVLFYYKYFAAIFNFASHIGILHSQSDISIILPLGISFFTFTQIGYLVDCRQGMGRVLSLLHYVVFVTFFPHLIAGPILHIREIAPQLLAADTYKLRAKNVAIGVTYFILGLSKKVLLADPLAQLADFGFSNPSHLIFTSAWAVALSYSLQLYFDFSGYSDMAIGLAYMFGIKFPLNFDSPYKARSIINFWQRWHMTLTRYLTLLLFNPLALWATRRRMARGRSVKFKKPTLGAFLETIVLPIAYTMLLAGIWHGAGFQFILFGLLHAFYLSVNHSWRTYGPKAAVEPQSLPTRMLTVAGQVAVTYLCVLVAQIVFRANSVEDALSLLAGMLGLHGIDPIYVSPGLAARLGNIGTKLADWGWITQTIPDVWPPRNPAGIFWRYLIIFALPNTQQFMSKFSPYLAEVRGPSMSVLIWEPKAAWAVSAGVILVLDLLSLNNSPAFLYFQF